MAPTRPLLVLLLGFDAELALLLRRRLGAAARVETAATAGEARGLAAREPVAVLGFGPGMAGAAARQLLDDLAPLPPADEPEHAPRDAAPLCLVTAGGADLSPFQELIDHDRLFYLSPSPPSAEDLAALFASALALAARRRQGTVVDTPEAPSELSRRVLAAAGRLAAPIADREDPAALASLFRDEISELLAADRGYLLLYDDAEEVLWAQQSALAGGERRESAAVGLVSFVVRTGRPAAVERMAADPRFEREADDPEGDAKGDGSLVATPVFAPASDPPRVIAVLVAVRALPAPAFSADDARALGRLAEAVQPLLAQVDAERRRRHGQNEEERRLREPALAVFREEALDHHLGSGRREGDLLRLSPRWLDWTYRLVSLLAAVGLLFLLFGTVHEYASGPALIRFAGRQEVTATANGTVSAVVVRPGQRVAEGQPLVQLYDAEEIAGLRRVEQEFELRLLERLRDPGDRAAEQSLGGLRTERDLARSRLGERVLRAPQAGTVADLRVRPGQNLLPGQVVASLSTGDPERPAGPPRLIALLPGQYQPQLRAGLPLRLEIQGYPYHYLHLRLDSVSREVIGPDEARRLLGPGVADTVALEGPVVIAGAPLPGTSFTIDGRTYRYSDGLPGRAEVQMRSQPILVALVPGLRAVFGDGE